MLCTPPSPERRENIHSYNISFYYLSLMLATMNTYKFSFLTPCDLNCKH